MKIKLPRPVRRNLRSIPHRLKLLKVAITADPMTATTAAQRHATSIADEDAWNGDYWFDKAAAEMLKWHLGPKACAHISFIRTKWEPLQWADKDNPVFSSELERQVLLPILEVLEINAEDFENELYDRDLPREEREAAMGDLLDRKAAARQDFAELVSCLVD